METVTTDTHGRFSVQIDLSNQIEGPVTLLAFQEGFRSVPLTGTYDITPPRITEAVIHTESIFLTFSESNLKMLLKFNPHTEAITGLITTASLMHSIGL